MFRVGQRVECIDDSSWQTWNTIELGRVYTIRAVVQHQGRTSLHLDEVISVMGAPYYGYRFRPVVERNTDISFAHEILRKASQKERA